MPRPRFERAAPELRVALLEAAADEFAMHGYEGASVNRILAAAGLSKGAFYYYFDDKADLAATVLAGESRAWLDTFASLPRPNTADEFWEGVERLNEHVMAQLQASPRHSDLMTRLGRSAFRDPELLARLAPAMQEARAAMNVFFLRGQQLGAVRADVDVDTLQEILGGAKQGLSLALLPADRAPTPEELARFGRVNLDLLRRLSEPARPAGAVRPARPSAAPRKPAKRAGPSPAAGGKRR